MFCNCKGVGSIHIGWPNGWEISLAMSPNKSYNSKYNTNTITDQLILINTNSILLAGFTRVMIRHSSFANAFNNFQQLEHSAMTPGRPKKFVNTSWVYYVLLYLASASVSFLVLLARFLCCNSYKRINSHIKLCAWITVYFLITDLHCFLKVARCCQ